MAEFQLYTPGGPMKVAAPSREEAIRFAIKDGHIVNEFTEAQELWLRDLEHTDAPQARLFLEVPQGFCCLGRACVVAEKKGVPVYKVKDHIGGSSLTEQQVPVLSWLGLTIQGEGLCINLNDGELKTFQEIAALIRRQPKRFFEGTNEAPSLS